MRKKIQVAGEEIYCDICSKKWTGFFKYSCSQCGKDLCRDCSIWHPYEDGDYPAKFCPECWKICEPFIKKIRKREKEQDKEIEKIEREMAEAVKYANQKLSRKTSANEPTKEREDLVIPTNGP